MMSQWNAPKLLLNTSIELGSNEFRNKRTRISKNNYVAKNQTKMPVSVTIWFPVYPTKLTYLISCFLALFQQIMTKIVIAKLSGTWELFLVNASKREWCLSLVEPLTFNLALHNSRRFMLWLKLQVWIRKENRYFCLGRWKVNCCSFGEGEDLFIISYWVHSSIG